MQQQQSLLEEQKRHSPLPRSWRGKPGYVRPLPVKPSGSWNHKKGGFRQWWQPEIEQPKTTVIMRNLPDGFSRDMVADILNRHGFAKKFNFVYVPIKFGTMACIGYAFVNFVSPAAAEECHSKLEGFCGWATPCENVLAVVWSDQDQGLASIVERHRNSPVMHDSVQDEFKP